MERESGLFAWIRRTSFLSFILTWVAGIFLFMFVYWLLALIVPGLSIGVGSNIEFTFLGLIESLYASLLTATLFGVITITASALYKIFIYIQMAFSGLMLLILLDKLLQKYIFPHYHAHHSQDKKINTMILTMSIFRNDIDRIKSELKSKSKHHLDIKEIEATIDGLYVTFLDIEKMFSAKNINKHNITDHQHAMVIANIEDSLEKLSKFIDFLEDHKLEWKDKSVEFWLRYILETADKITLHFEDVKIKNPRMIVSLENIKDWTQTIEKKL